MVGSSAVHLSSQAHRHPSENIKPPAGSLRINPYPTANRMDMKKQTPTLTLDGFCCAASTFFAALAHRDKFGFVAPARTQRRFTRAGEHFLPRAIAIGLQHATRRCV